MLRTTLLSTLLLTAHAGTVTAGPATMPAVPATGCGYISTQMGSIPVNERRELFRAEITAVDGKSTPLYAEYQRRVDAGTRQLTVADGIEWSTHSLNGAQRAQIERMKRHERRHAYKTLELEVEPGVTYVVGARLLRDRLDAQSIRDNAYWEPVVWQERPGTCS